MNVPLSRSITNFVPEAPVSLDEDLEALTPAVETSMEDQPIAEEILSGCR